MNRHAFLGDTFFGTGVRVQGGKSFGFTQTAPARSPSTDPYSLKELFFWLGSASFLKKVASRVLYLELKQEASFAYFEPKRESSFAYAGLAGRGDAGRLWFVVGCNLA